MLSISHIIAAVALSLLACLANANDTVSNAGFRLVEMKDPITQSPMKVAVFYPTKERGDATKMGPLEIAATKNASVQSGRYPLVLLSHGNGGSMFSHHDTATFLARHGYIVAAIEHPGDNVRDGSGLGTDRVLIGRNLQMTAMLDFLLINPSFAPFIDPAKVGVAGFSAGGYTALLMVGAKPKFALLGTYCAQNPKSVLCAGGGTVRVSSPALAAKADARIRAAFVMSPPAAFFDRESLSFVSAPVELHAAANDSVLPIQNNARRVRDGVPTLVKYAEIPGADHYVFLSPCTPQMKSIAPALCVDPPGIDRLAIHETLHRNMQAFFQSRLGASN